MTPALRWVALVMVLVVVGSMVSERHPRLPPPRCPLAGGPPTGPATIPPVAPSFASIKGPVGWDTFRQLADLPILPVGVQARMFSSADPRGGNADGFFGAYLCRDGEDYVLGEHAGPGEITSMWFTRGNGDVTANGRIRVELDGEPVIDAPLQEVVDGELGAPFVTPLVGNADESSGGVYIQVPMPFRQSMRVLTDTVPRFYRVQYRTFADTAGVERFDSTHEAADVVAALRAAGSGDPKPASQDTRSEHRQVSLPPGQSLQPLRLRGPGVITALRIDLPQVPRLPQPGRRQGAGSQAMDLDVDPDNTGVRLVRWSPTREAAQTAPVLLNETPPVRSFAPPSQAPDGGVEQVLDLPADATANRDQVLLADVAPGPAILEVQSRVQGRWMVTDRRDLVPAPGPTGDPPPDPAQVLRGLRLRISFDGRRTVDVPVGDLFGIGLGARPASTLMFAADPALGYRAWWPMPFARDAAVTLHNDADVTIHAGRLAVDWNPDPRWADALGPGGRAGHFHATARAGATTPGQDWEMAAIEGHGRVVGFSQTFVGREPGRTYLEGDERVFVDGAGSPQLHGTGTEDLYLGGWYFNRGTFATPFSGLSAYLRQEAGCRLECDAAYRSLFADALPFHRALDFRIEHGIDNRFAADYASSVFWYGRDDPAMRRTDALDVGDPRSELAHLYTDLGRLRRLRALYPGHHRLRPLDDRLRESRGSIRFRLSLDPDNAGVLLRRRADQARRGQAAHVLVDDVPTGTWFQPQGNRSRRWLDDDLLVPAALTRGRDSVEITLRPLPAAPPWTAARYEAFSLAGPTVVRGAPAVGPPRPRPTEAEQDQ